MNWAAFERFALSPETLGHESAFWFWPEFIAEMIYIVAAPVREWLIYHRFMA